MTQTGSRFLRISIDERTGHRRCRVVTDVTAASDIQDCRQLVAKLWASYSREVTARFGQTFSPELLSGCMVPREVMEHHLLVELYRPHAFPILLAEMIAAAFIRDSTEFPTHPAPPLREALLSLPPTAGDPHRLAALVEMQLQARLASPGWFRDFTSRTKALAGLATGAVLACLGVMRLALLQKCAPRVQSLPGKNLYVVYSGKAAHTRHIWAEIDKSPAGAPLVILVLGHTLLEKKLRTQVQTKGGRVIHLTNARDLGAAVIALSRCSRELLRLHRCGERDLGIQFGTSFHVRTGAWFMRGLMHDRFLRSVSMVNPEDTVAVFGLIAHADSRLADFALRQRGVKTFHWLHGIVEDGLHYRANSSVCLCQNQVDAELRLKHGAYGSCRVYPQTRLEGSPTEHFTAQNSGIGALLITNLIHPDNRFADYGAATALEELMRMTADCCHKMQIETFTWRPHPKESTAADFARFESLAIDLGFRVDNTTHLADQIRSHRNVIVTFSGSIGDVVKAGVLPAIFAGLPYETEGHWGRLPEALKFHSSHELAAVLARSSDSEWVVKHGSSLLLQYNQSQTESVNFRSLLEEMKEADPVTPKLENAYMADSNTSSQTDKKVSKISIVTPSFRQVNFLKCAAASVRDQRGDFMVEHLIHDGDSGDEFNDWAKSQQSAVCVSEPDNGMYDAINRGFRKAKGEIIAWLNCDEQYLPGALQRVARYFEDHPEIDILLGDVILVDEVMTPLAYRRAVMPTLGHIRYSHLSTFSAATFVRRRVLDDGHFLQTRWKTIADATWIEELLRTGYRAATLREPLAVFCMLGSNLGQSALLFDERREWEREIGATSKWRKQWYVTQYRLERLRMGAYWLRKVVVSAYIPGNQERVRQERWVSGRWTPARNEAANLRSHRDGALGGLTARLRSPLWAAIHAICLIAIAIYVDGLTQGDAIKGPPILLSSLMYLTFRSRLRDLIPVAALYFIVSLYLLSERPFDVLVVRLLTFTVGAALAIFWSASLRNLEEWIHSTVALIRRMSEPILLTNRHGVVILVNNAACALLQGNEQIFLDRKLLPMSLAGSNSTDDTSMVHDLDEWPPDESLGLALDEITGPPMATASVSIVGKGRYRLYAFTLEKT